MNLGIGKIKRYINKILISTPGFKIGTNLKINLDDDKIDVKSKKENIIADIKSKKDIKIIRTRPDMNDEITYEEEKAAFILGMTVIFTVR